MINKLFKLFPECSLKNQIRCFFYNLKNDDFKIYYDKYFIVKVDGFRIKFSHNPYYSVMMDLCSIRNYFKKYTPKRGDYVVEGGSYVGLFTLIASKLVGEKGKVITFEPDVNNYKILLCNLKLNNTTNVIAINKGLWSEDTSLQLQTKDIGSSFFSGNIHDPIISVPAVSLDNELKRLNIKKVDFIKMDVEGAEIEAVKGCKNTLKRNKPKIAIASYHIVNGRQTCFELKKMFSKMGYKSETSPSKPLITYV